MFNPTFSFFKKPQLTLVGAGPGDPELITLKALKALEAADIVLYDALVSREVLEYIPAPTPVICVGKRAGQHAYTQDEINALIVESAFLHGHVVRLKGGDPFVFGRATEEIQHASQYGIPTRVVPGISSALAVPAALSIPLTSRGVSESFWVVTGTTMTGGLSDDVALAAQSSATVIILMGLKKLGEIMAVFSAHGKGETPVAVIQNGTLPTQKHVTGTVSTIAQLVRQEDLGSPGIIIAGEVVRFSNLSKSIALNFLKVGE
ncbi:MAG: uroporphyrinogen-III C-methyltransferase [Bacteroidota bacterium]|nr:uroporphyrinogen-III C-methyltransferase [Bacteroidota bacterium]